LEKELAVVMTLTLKLNDVNDIFADISVTPATAPSVELQLAVKSI